MISRVGQVTTHRRTRGFTLIELLIGASIAAVILGAAYAWLWDVGAIAGGTDDRVQAATLAAAVSRAVAADVYSSVGVVEPPAGRDPSRSLALLHDHVAGAPEAVLIVWDPARGVVWRNASGTYLADRVVRFDVAYALADGSLIDGGDMTSSRWSAVRAVHVVVEATVGSATARRSLETSVGPS
jgi:prepilin-type N-terminal cleavage/methylation domain-containing protein